MTQNIKYKAKIIGTGSYLPERKLDNYQLSQKLAVTENWIIQRTGIVQRSVADPQQTTSDLAVLAAKKAISASGISISEIDVILVATSTPDKLLPSTASILQNKLGITSAGAFDLGAACSGFIYGLTSACAYIHSGLAKNILLVSAELRTRFVNYDDPETAVLYGDGAGAVIITSSDQNDAGIIDLSIGSDGLSENKISIPAGGSFMPASHETVDKKLHCISMQGKKIINSAVRTLTKLIENTLTKADLTYHDLNFIIPHQMNLRIIEMVAKKTNIPMEKFFINIDRCANTSSASIPIALDQASQKNMIRPGSLILLVSFGAGFTWGSALIRW